MKRLVVLGPYPCPCCGALVFDEPPGSYDICPVCGWEEPDLAQLRFPRMGGGPNRESLMEAQQRWTNEAVDELQRGYPREENWRPLDPSRDDIEAPVSGRDYGATYEADRTMYYYWRTSREQRGEGAPEVGGL